jgi:hypothetical protein
LQESQASKANEDYQVMLDRMEIAHIAPDLDSLLAIKLFSSNAISDALTNKLKNKICPKFSSKKPTDNEL